MIPLRVDNMLSCGKGDSQTREVRKRDMGEKAERYKNPGSKN